MRHNQNYNFLPNVQAKDNVDISDNTNITTVALNDEESGPTMTNPIVTTTTALVNPNVPTKLTRKVNPHVYPYILMTMKLHFHNPARGVNTTYLTSFTILCFLTPTLPSSQPYFAP